MQNIKTQKVGEYSWLFDADCIADISAEHFSAQYWESKHAITGKESGRGTTYFVRHQDHHLVLRHYLRGGLMSKISKDNYLFTRLQNCRAIAEFQILSDLHEEGLPVPKPAAAQVIRKGLHYKADLLTHRIPHAQDLVQILKSPKDELFYQALGLIIARFHQQGVYHADLNIQNILQDDSGQFWLIDFDRAKRLKPQQQWQEKNLSRLKRSFEKEKRRFGIQWQESDWLTFLNAYQKANPLN